jgi:enamine deaminase RidA (YjgF/YER057c/UK114 family)
MFGEIFSGGDPVPVGIRAGNLIHGSRLSGGAGTLEEQGRRALNVLQASVDAAGGTLDNVAQVSFFLAEARPGMAALNPLWVDMFPEAEDRPTYKFMTAPLPTGCLVQLDYFAVLGARRRVLAVDGVAHTNPIPLGVAIGEYLFSSRILPNDPATGAAGPDAPTQAELVFDNASKLLAAGGFAWRDVVQGRSFIAEDAYRPLVEMQWAKNLGATVARARLQHTVYAVAPTLRVMLEIFCDRSGAK